MTNARFRYCAHANAELMGTGKLFTVLPRAQSDEEGKGDAPLPLCRFVRTSQLQDFGNHWEVPSREATSPPLCLAGTDLGRRQ